VPEREAGATVIVVQSFYCLADPSRDKAADAVAHHPPDDHHHRLRQLASRRGVGLNKLFEELSPRAIVETDAENSSACTPKGRHRQAGPALQVMSDHDGKSVAQVKLQRLITENIESGRKDRTPERLLEAARAAARKESC
jgi:uncharacterized protein involved in copper resistance